MPTSSHTQKLTQVVRQRGSLEDESEQPVASSSTTQQRQKKTPNRYMPIKVEPKTYFANERTFIQWASAALLILAMSTALSALNDTSAKVGSVFLMPIAVFFLFYAGYIFHWRAKKIRTGHRGTWTGIKWDSCC